MGSLAIVIGIFLHQNVNISINDVLCQYFEKTITILEYWNIERMENRNDGRLEWWKIQDLTLPFQR